MTSPARTMFHLLPSRTGAAAENMALDFLLLQRYPEPEAARFRHYDWRTPSVTFGYSQKWEFVISQSAPGLDFCRRPTGGGIVNHTSDWTYALVIPKTHSLCREPAPISYYLVHQALCDALSVLNQDVILQTEDLAAPKKGPGLCFVEAEPHDVIHRVTRAKVAGAALKRGRSGLLLQGSISRDPLPDLNWERFEKEFTARLATCLEANSLERPWPALDPEEEAMLVDRFSDPEWNERR